MNFQKAVHCCFNLLSQPMPKIDWNADGLYYILKYRSLPSGAWVTERLSDPNIGVFAIPNPGYYKPWEFQIQPGNNIGMRDPCPIVQSFSGQDPPTGRPEDLTTGAVTARTVELTWKPVSWTRGSVDGYRVSCLKIFMQICTVDYTLPYFLEYLEILGICPPAYRGGEWSLRDCETSSFLCEPETFISF